MFALLNKTINKDLNGCFPGWPVFIAIITVLADTERVSQQVLMIEANLIKNHYFITVPVHMKLIAYKEDR